MSHTSGPLSCDRRLKVKLLKSSRSRWPSSDEGPKGTILGLLLSTSYSSELHTCVAGSPDVARSSPWRDSLDAIFDVRCARGVIWPIRDRVLKCRIAVNLWEEGWGLPSLQALAGGIRANLMLTTTTTSFQLQWWGQHLSEKDSNILVGCCQRAVETKEWCCDTEKT